MTSQSLQQLGLPSSLLWFPGDRECLEQSKGKTERSPSIPQDRDSCLNVNEIRTESSKMGV